MENFLLQATIFLAAAVVAVPIAARLGLGSVLGYLLAGVIIGPVTGLIGLSQSQDLQHIAEFGVVMMLFLIGLELDPRALWAMRDRIIGLGGLQILMTGAGVTTLAIYLGQPTGSAIAIGMIFALSSTAIVLQTITEKGLMKTAGGRSTFSVLLTQDIAVIPMLAILPLLASHSVPVSGAVSDHHGNAVHGEDHAQTIIDALRALPPWAETLVILGVLAGIVLAGIYLTQPIFRFIHAARLREMYTSLALLIVVGIAFMMYAVGLSPALGAFLAGVVLANSEFRHELESDLQPFKSLFLGLFFITVGAGINFETLFQAPLQIISFTLGLIAIKAAVLFVLGWAFGLRGRDQWLFTLSLAQAGEFGFVLIGASLQLGVLTTEIGELLLLVVALSMLVTPLLFILHDLIARNSIIPDDGPPVHDEIDETGPVIIVGIGRFGQIVNRLVRGAGFQTVVLDRDLETIHLMRRFGVKGFFGDPTRPQLLHAAGLADARVLVVALDDPEAAVKLVTYARRERPDLHIIARAKDRTQTYALYRAGANDIVRELFDSSLRAGRYVLENIGLNEYEAAQAEQAFYHHDRDTIAELADIWVPGTPSAKNAAYMARAKQLEKEFESQLQTILEERDNAA